MVVTFFQKQTFLGCWKDLRVWVKTLLLKWKSKNRTSSKKMLLKELYFLAVRKNCFVRAAQNYFDHFSKYILCWLLLNVQNEAVHSSFYLIWRALMSWILLKKINKTRTKTFLRTFHQQCTNSFVRPAQNFFCEPQQTFLGKSN